MQNRLLTLLNIRSDESWLVTNLFLLQFFQGAGVAIFNTVAFALFLEKFQITELPKVYIFSALLLWAAGWLYSKLEHALHVKQLVPVVILFLAFSILAFRLQFSLLNSSAFIFLMFSWYYVIYLLNNLEFWGAAALLFDIRQSKRLFSLIGAGDIPAKLIGYSLVPVLIPFIGTLNMLYLAGCSILFSLVFYYRLRRAGKLDIHVAHEKQHKQKHSATTLSERVKSFFGNRLIALLAALSFTVMVCVTIIGFAFYAEIKHEAHSNEQLASFLAVFFAGGRVLAIFIRVIFTGRIAARFGNKGALLLSPVIFFLFLLLLILLPFVPHETTTVLYVFGIMTLVSEMLKISLQDPTFLSLMQALSLNLRLKGHTIVKGIMDPFALAFSGVLLLGLLHVFEKIDLVLLGYLLFVLLLVWVGMALLVDKEYVRTLVTALNRRYSVGQEINLAEEKTQQVLRGKVQSGERGEAIYILHLVDKQYTAESSTIILLALNHPDGEVQREALQLVEKRKLTAALPLIDRVIAQKENTPLLAEAVKAKCILQPDELADMDSFLDKRDNHLLKATVVGLMTSGGIAAVVTAGQKLLTLITSSVAEDRKTAAQIIGELGVSTFYKPLLQLLQDENQEVVAAAIAASGKVKNKKLVHPLIQHFKRRKWERAALEALYEMKNLALPEVSRLLEDTSLAHRQQTLLILLCGRVGTPEAVAVLVELVKKLPTMHRLIFHALHLCNFRATPQQQQNYEGLIRQYMNAATRILFMIEALPETATNLERALYLELDELRDSLLLLFSFIYDKEKMIKARNTFQMKKHKEAIANALEIIEIEVAQEVAAMFVILFEPSSVADRCRALEAYFKETFHFDSIIDELLYNRHHAYHRWTRAVAVYSLKQYTGKQKQEWLHKAAGESDILLSETATALLT